jgi:class 3 adenylate cyclase
MAMRDELNRASSQFEREFGVVPRIRGSLHFGPVIVGEIGDIKRAIVFNGDVMNTAARLEELSRSVDGGFLVSVRRCNGSTQCRRSRFAISAGYRFAAAPMASMWSASARRL